jgi:hypothetical protein
MILQSSMGLGKSRCDPKGTTQRWACPTLLFTIHLHLTSTTSNQSHNCIWLFTHHLPTCTTRLVKNHLYLQTQFDI